MRQPHALVATAARRSVATAASPASPPPAAPRDALLGAVRSAAGPLYDRALADAGPDTPTVFDSVKVNDLATSLGHAFNHRWLLRAAFMHRSFDAETYRTRSADLLAWLGDASMYQGATMALVAGCPAAAIGSLTDARKALISRAACARAGRAVGIHTLLRTGGSFAASDSGAGGVTDSMVAEAFESMVGAVAVDGGHDAAVRAFWRVQPLVNRMQDMFAGSEEAGAAGQQAPSSAPGAAASTTPPPNTDLAALRAAVRDAAGPLYDRVLADAGPDTASVFDAEKLTKLETALGHPFREPWLLHAALMHRSYDAETYRSRSSELLAWIGDASMYQGATMALLARFPTAALGELSVARAAHISRAACARAGRELGIDILLASGASFASTNTNVGGATDAMVAEAFESVLGAIAVDGGHDAAVDAFWRVHLSGAEGGG